MNIEYTSVSCGVHRIFISNNEKPTQKQLSELIQANKNYCAIVVAAIPTKRQDVISLLLANDFVIVKNPDKKYEIDHSVNNGFADMANLIMHHDHEQDMIDDAVRFEQFTSSTTNIDDLANLVMHHGNELIGSIIFLIRYMNK